MTNSTLVLGHSGESNVNFLMITSVIVAAPSILALLVVLVVVVHYRNDIMRQRERENLEVDKGDKDGFLNSSQSSSLVSSLTPFSRSSHLSTSTNRLESPSLVPETTAPWVKTWEKRKHQSGKEVKKLFIEILTGGGESQPRCDHPPTKEVNESLSLSTSREIAAVPFHLLKHICKHEVERGHFASPPPLSPIVVRHQEQLSVGKHKCGLNGEPGGEKEEPPSKAEQIGGFFYMGKWYSDAILTNPKYAVNDDVPSSFSEESSISTLSTSSSGRRSVEASFNSQESTLPTTTPTTRVTTSTCTTARADYNLQQLSPAGVRIKATSNRNHFHQHFGNEHGDDVYIGTFRSPKTNFHRQERGF